MEGRPRDLLLIKLRGTSILYLTMKERRTWAYRATMRSRATEVEEHDDGRITFVLGSETWEIQSQDEGEIQEHKILVIRRMDNGTCTRVIVLAHECFSDEIDAIMDEIAASTPVPPSI